MSDQPALPPAPRDLAYQDVMLVLAHTAPGDPSRGLAPWYHFRILLTDGTDVGHINFRVGDTGHVRLAAGHIGFEIREECRGRRFAYQACRAIEPFVKTIYPSVILTCDPGNAPSKKTIEKLGCAFIDESAVPADDPHYQRGSRTKLRYRWTPTARA